VIIYQNATIIITGKPGAYSYRWSLGSQHGKGAETFAEVWRAEHAARQEIDSHLRQRKTP
jgi:hypothetical protein